jgi:hypothetical protein
MRRTKAILVIIALLATPLALLARAAGIDAMDCNGMCCLPHGPHHSMPHHPPQSSTHDSISCEHGAAAHIFECAMNAGHQHMDYGFFSPSAPAEAFRACVNKCLLRRGLHQRVPDGQYPFCLALS